MPHRNRFAPGPALLGLFGAVCLNLAPSPALADRIDGQWCAPDGKGRLQIDGPDIVTPGGNRIQGQYGRHNFVYVIPEGEPGTGITVSMIQLHEMAINRQQGNGPVETWTRCQDIS